MSSFKQKKEMKELKAASKQMRKKSILPGPMQLAQTDSIIAFGDMKTRVSSFKLNVLGSSGKLSVTSEDEPKELQSYQDELSRQSTAGEIDDYPEIIKLESHFIKSKLAKIQLLAGKIDRVTQNGGAYLLKKVKTPLDEHSELKVHEKTSQCPFIIKLVTWFTQGGTTIMVRLFFIIDNHLFLIHTQVFDDKFPINAETAQFSPLKRQWVERDKIRFAAELCLAVEAVHKSDHVIFNLSTRNIFMSRKGHLLLTDLSAAIPSSDTDSKTYDINDAYHPPVSEPVGVLGDYWSVGICLIELLSGCNPIYESSAASSYINIQDALRFDFNGILIFGLEGTEWKPELVSFIRGLVQKDPLERLGFQEDSVQNHQLFTGNIPLNKYARQKVKPSAEYES